MSSVTEKNDVGKRQMFSGEPGAKFDWHQMEKQTARWCRSQLETEVGNMLWHDNFPKIEGEGSLSAGDWTQHAELILEAIGVRNPTRAANLYPVDSGFWNRKWHVRWRKEQRQRLYDHMETYTCDDAAIELANLGVENAHRIRQHFTKQFGGAGDDVRAREEHYAAGMPNTPGESSFPRHCNMEKKLRELGAERIALWRMCRDDKRNDYEFGKESTLVKIVLKHLRGTEYSRVVQDLLQEIKLKRAFMARLPVVNADGVLELPVNVEGQQEEDWDYRNYSDDWLPSWVDLRSKLVAAYKAKQFAKASSGSKKDDQLGAKKLPTMIFKAVKEAVTMLAPGFGLNPKPSPGNGLTERKDTCWACGEVGHRRGDPECKKGPNELHHTAPARVKQRTKNGKRGSPGGFKAGKREEVCRMFRDTGKCRYGEKCKFKHVQSEEGPNPKKYKLTKAAKKEITAAAVQHMQKKLAEDGGSSSADNAELTNLLKGFMFVKTIPRTCVDQRQKIVKVSAMAASSLLAMTDVCEDTGSATGISTDPRDMPYIDRSAAAQDSVLIRGPSVGTPRCAGIGPLIYRVRVNNIPMGIVHPEGVLADPGDGPTFRISAAQELKKHGLRLVGGKFDADDQLECVRSNQKVRLETKDGILVMETDGTADELADTPELRSMVQAVHAGKRSPLVDLRPFLTSVYDKKENNLCIKKHMKETYLAKFLLSAATTMIFSSSTMIFNEAKMTDIERSRLWAHRIGHGDTAQFGIMSKMDEYGGFPNLPKLNEDDLIGDMAKFKKGPHKRNDPVMTMDSPPWWRIFLDGYGGQNSLGGESREGAVGAYLFVCAATGSVDHKLYASHEQFPIALHQFLVRVEAEHWKCHVIFVDTHRVNLSEDAEVVCAEFGVQIVPVSAGTPQEMAFAESRVRMVKRMSTAMLAGAPHLPANSWALADKYACYVADFLPQQTRNNHCAFYLRTGMHVNWKLVCIKVFGAPLVFSPMNGPIHKRAPVAEEGFFMGIQWPAAIVRRKSDGMILNVARQKIRVHESIYTTNLRSRVKFSGEVVENDNWEAKDEKQNTPSIESRPETDNNCVQSIKALRQHRFRLPGQNPQPSTKLDESAMQVYSSNGQEIYGQGGEGLYVPEYHKPVIDRVTLAIEEARRAASVTPGKKSMWDKVVEQLTKAGDAINSAVGEGQLKIGKRAKRGDVSKDNILIGKRKKRKVAFVGDLKTKNFGGEVFGSEAEAQTKGTSESQSVPPVGDIRTVKRGRGRPPKNRNVAKPTGQTEAKKEKRGRPRKLKKGDLVSAPSQIFDDEHGSFSSENPGLQYGTVVDAKDNGVIYVRWLDDKEILPAKWKDLTLVKEKLAIVNIIALLVKGGTVAFESKDKDSIPKDFFEVLCRKDWRKWVEAVKKELQGWMDNDAVSVVDIKDVPVNAKVVPLGELYSIKRDGRYKYRQYLMGNLLRKGIDYGDTFSTTISGSGLCTFYSLATTCGKLVHGWDAICGYLQVREQYEIYAFLPTHHGYSDLEYEELGQLRQSFLKLVKEEGMEGLRKFAKRAKREGRSNPKSVYKCNRAVYGGPGCGNAFEMLMHSVHTQTAGLTQTQPEPSMYVKISVDNQDEVVGYLVVMAFVDDVRFFGTDPEIAQYKKAVSSRMKVTFEEPPIQEFVSIETYQCLETRTTELKMPTYWKKAKLVFTEYRKEGFKERWIPLTVADEATLMEAVTEQEMEEAKRLPFLQLIGVMSYPASQCKFEMRYVVSLLGTKRARWSKKIFEVALKAFEYGLTTRELGLIYSDGLDPHGANTLYAYGDANLRLPRPQGCRIVMMNGAAISFASKKQTLTAPSTCWAESVTLFDTTTDVLGIRNLLAELGQYQEAATTIYCDNQSAIQIANHRGSLGKSSRAMDLKTLSTRNRIEDHLVETQYCETKDMVADMGTKALVEALFVRLRDIMNGYALVRAAYPNKRLPSYVYQAEKIPQTKGVSTLSILLQYIDGLQYISAADIADVEE